MLQYRNNNLLNKYANRFFVHLTVYLHYYYTFCRNIMNIGKRLKLFREDHLKISVSAFERRSNIGTNIYKNITTNIKTEYINKIHKSFPELNITWLMTGSGEMLIKEELTEESVFRVIANNLLSDDQFINKLSKKLLNSDLGELVIDNKNQIALLNAEIVNSKSQIKSKSKNTG